MSDLWHGDCWKCSSKGIPIRKLFFGCTCNSQAKFCDMCANLYSHKCPFCGGRLTKLPKQGNTDREEGPASL